MKSVTPPGLRDRKKAETRVRIHKEALRLFERQGFANTTVAEIAEAADVSPRTVFLHYPTKEDIVFGDVSSALDWLETALRSRPAGTTTSQVVREWLDRLGAWWLDPDVELQVRLADENQSVAERKAHIAGLFRHRIIEGLAVDFDKPADDLSVDLAASAIAAGLLHLEARVSDEVRSTGHVPPPQSLLEILDRVDLFVSSGVEALER